MQPATAGFAFTSWPALDAADSMHCDDGIIRHIMQQLHKKASTAALAAISTALKTTPRFPGLPSMAGGMSNGGFSTCASSIARAKVLPAAMLAGFELDDDVRIFIIIFQGELYIWRACLPIPYCPQARTPSPSQCDIYLTGHTSSVVSFLFLTALFCATVPSSGI